MKSVLWLAILSLTLANQGCSSRNKSQIVAPGTVDRPTAQSNTGNDARAPEKVLGPSEYLKDQAAFSQLSAEGNRALAEEGTAVMDIDVEQYRLKGRFDWDERVFHAAVSIDMVVRSDGGNALALDSAVRTIRSVRVRSQGIVDPSDESNSLSELVPFQLDRTNRKLIISKLDLPVEGQRAGGRITVEVEYDAASNSASTQAAGQQTSSTLHAVAPRADDPISSRVVYTTAEPLGAANWMPCNNTPADRALFRVQLELPATERAIANGRLIQEVVDSQSGTRKVEYATDYSLPTYLMAFAMGEFQVTELQSGNLPLSIWSRKGLRFDASTVLESIATMIGVIESKLIPYPFEKYALVMLPQFPAGGIEHASISFQAETRSTEAYNVRDYSLTAHELGHQWFGDYITVKSWDDLWVKEGMATLLSAEATRPFEDKGLRGTLFGHYFGFVQGEAMRDPDLAPGAKYTSGPYSRAAWFYNQLRSVLGEEAFWGTLKGLLQANAFGIVGTQDVLDAFRPLLTESQFAAASAAVVNRDVPRFVASESGSRLEDPGTSLVAPLEFRVVRPDGSEDVRLLSPGGVLPNSLLRDANSVTVFDPLSVHPDLADFGEEAPKLLQVDRQLTASELARVSQLGPVAFLRTIAATKSLQFTMDSVTGLPTQAEATEFEAVFSGLGSYSSQLSFLQRFCSGIESIPAPQAVQQLRQLGMTFYSQLSFRGARIQEGNLRGCLSEDQRTVQLGRLKQAADAGELSSLDMNALQQFLAGDAQAWESWRQLALKGVSLRVRTSAAVVLSDELSALVAAGTLEADAPLRKVWRDTVNDVIGISATSEGLRNIGSLASTFARIPVTSGALSGTQLRPGYTRLLLKQLPKANVQTVICSARQILGKTAWKTMLGDIAQGANGEVVARIASNPQSCN
jgi:aminopeptidase N